MNLKTIFASMDKTSNNCAYNPQQNDITEGMNRIILNMVHSMRFLKNVKLIFWVDAILCDVYMKNMCQSNSIETVNIMF